MARFSTTVLIVFLVSLGILIGFGGTLQQNHYLKEEIAQSADPQSPNEESSIQIDDYNELSEAYEEVIRQYNEVLKELSSSQRENEALNEQLAEALNIIAEKDFMIEHLGGDVRFYQERSTSCETERDEEYQVIAQENQILKEENTSLKNSISYQQSNLVTSLRILVSELGVGQQWMILIFGLMMVVVTIVSAIQAWMNWKTRKNAN